MFIQIPNFTIFERILKDDYYKLLCGVMSGTSLMVSPNTMAADNGVM